MNEKFFDLKKEKQDSMLNAAMRVFAVSGYDKASTDEMVKKAGISKGLLFHYFGSKTGLYEFLYGYAAKYMLMELSAGVNKTETDYFAVRGQIERARCTAMMNFPYIQLFLSRAAAEVNSDVAELVKEQKEELERAYSEFYASVDYEASGIKEPDTFLAMVEYTFKGLLEEAADNPYFSVEAYRRKGDTFLEAFKKLCRV